MVLLPSPLRLAGLVPGLSLHKARGLIASYRLDGDPYTKLQDEIRAGYDITLDIRPTVYVAASLADRAEAQQLASCLLQAKILVHARWLRADRDSDIALNENLAANVVLDSEDLWIAGALVVLTGQDASRSTSGGMHSEIGIAHILEIPIYVLGPRTSFFLNSPRVYDVSGVDELVGMLR